MGDKLQEIEKSVLVSCCNTVSCQNCSTVPQHIFDTYCIWSCTGAMNTILSKYNAIVSKDIVYMFWWWCWRMLSKPCYEIIHRFSMGLGSGDCKSHSIWFISFSSSSNHSIHSSCTRPHPSRFEMYHQRQSVKRTSYWFARNPNHISKMPQCSTSERTSRLLTEDTLLGSIGFSMILTIYCWKYVECTFKIHNGI